ncbi:MAG: transaldolase, partial [Bacteroidota bacterium]|nr:transaldolase [Bacteroidota bacterium]
MNTGVEQSFVLGKFKKQVDSRLRKLDEEKFVQRMWNKDSSLWNTPSGTVAKSLPLGWLDVVDKMLAAVPEIESFRDRMYAAGFRQVVLLGMGGSSLAPYVLQKTFQTSKVMRLIVLDSTDPESVKKTESGISMENTLFIVSSKSGNTAEVMAFFNYFYARVFELKGEKAGDNFIAITDEGSPLTKLARKKNFRELFINFSDIGGRFSALSYFGIIPAALIGINISAFLQQAKSMMEECGPDVPASQNPGVILGVAIAEMASKGCNKLTYLMPWELSSFGLWLEQLIAESTGKQGKGILPINGIPLLEIDTYGKDRCFLSIGFINEPDYVQNQRLKDFTFLDYPLINIQIKDVMELGREFFRWEIATAVAGAVLEMDPFDQPNVEESKKCTNKLLAKLEEEGHLPETSTALV